MLLTIHNLPINIKIKDVKALIHSKCGFSEMILDNLTREGNGMKVTVGLAEEEDAAILVRKINGILIQGNQLLVEDVRKKKANMEQPYYNAKASAVQEQPYFQSKPMAVQEQPYFQASASAAPAQPMEMQYMQPNNAYMSQMGMYAGYYMPNNPYMAYGQQPMQLAPSSSGMYQSADNQYKPPEFRPEATQNREQIDTKGDRRSRSRDRGNLEDIPRWQSDRVRHDREQSDHDRRRRETPPRKSGYDRDNRERENYSRYDDRKRERSRSPAESMTRKMQRAQQYRHKKLEQHRDNFDRSGTNSTFQDWRENSNNGPPQKRSRFESISNARNDPSGSFTQNESETRPWDRPPYQSKNQNMISSPPNPKFQPGPSNSTFQSRSTNLKFQPNFASQPRAANPKFQPRPPNSEFKPRQSNPKFQPNPANPQFQPRGAKPQFQPRGANPKFQPQGGNSQFQPRGVNPQSQPRGANPQYQPRGASPQFQPHGKNPKFQPRGANPKFQPRGVNSQFQPRGANPQFQPRGENPKFQPRSANPNFEPRVSGPKFEPRAANLKFEPRGANPKFQSSAATSQFQPNPKIDNTQQNIITDNKLKAWIDSSVAIIAKEMTNNVIIHIDMHVFLKVLKQAIRQRMFQMYVKRKPKFAGEILGHYRTNYTKKSDKVLFVEALERATILDAENTEARRQKELKKAEEAVNLKVEDTEKQSSEAEPSQSKDETIEAPQDPIPSEVVEVAEPQAKPVPVAQAFRPAPSLNNQLAKILGAGNKKGKKGKNQKSEIKLQKQQTKLIFQNEEIVTNALDAFTHKALDEEVERIAVKFAEECQNPEAELGGFVDRLKGEVLDDLRTVLKVNVSRRLLDFGSSTLRIFCCPKPPKKSVLEPFLKKHGIVSLKKSAKRPMYLATCRSYAHYDKLIAMGTIPFQDVSITFKPLQLAGPPKKVTKDQIKRQRENFIQSQKFQIPPGQVDELMTDAQQIIDSDMDYTKDIEIESDGEEFEEANDEEMNEEQFVEDNFELNENQGEANNDTTDTIEKETEKPLEMTNEIDNQGTNVLGDDETVDNPTDNVEGSLNDSLNENIEFTTEDQQIIEDALMSTQDSEYVGQEKLPADEETGLPTDDSQIEQTAENTTGEGAKKTDMPTEVETEHTEDLNDNEENTEKGDEKDAQIGEVDENDLEDW